MFSNILIPFSSFSRIDKTDLEHFPARVFFKNSEIREAMGPLRQATGPPRSGAGVGVGILREAGADTRRGPYVLY